MSGSISKILRLFRSPTQATRIPPGRPGSPRLIRITPRSGYSFDPGSCPHGRTTAQSAHAHRILKTACTCTNMGPERARTASDRTQGGHTRRTHAPSALMHIGLQCMYSPIMHMHFDIGYWAKEAPRSASNDPRRRPDPSQIPSGAAQDRSKIAPRWFQHRSGRPKIARDIAQKPSRSSQDGLRRPETPTQALMGGS